MSDWGGKRNGAGRRPRKSKSARLQVSVLSSTLAKINKLSFDLGISRGEVVDKKFEREETPKK
jgi:hypothetical protein